MFENVSSIWLLTVVNDAPRPPIVPVIRRALSQQNYAKVGHKIIAG
jgi:hypothetical protein